MAKATNKTKEPKGPKKERPKQEEMPLTGKGVEQVKDKKLTQWAEEFIEARDQKAELTTKMTELESKMLDRMAELQIPVYRFSDQKLEIKTGKTHVKIKTVKVDEDAAANAAPEQVPGADNMGSPAAE